VRFRPELNNVVIYQNDHLGTPQKLTAVNGAVVWSAKYSSFGEADIGISSTVTNNLRFPGQYFDIETGLHYNWHRYYSPEAGKYLRVDPSHSQHADIEKIPYLISELLAIPQELNAYSFVRNRPTNLTDAMGLYTIDSSCDLQKRALLAIALVDVERAIQSNCIRGQSLKNCLTDKLNKLKIKCTNKSGCGSAWPIFSNTIKINPAAFKPGGGCGPLESTILHEMVHSCGRFFEKKPKGCEESCFGYDPKNEANPCDCK